MKRTRTFLALRGAEAALELANTAERWGFPGVAYELRRLALHLIFRAAVEDAGRVVLRFL